VTTHEAAVRSSPLTETTTALFALLGLIDIALLAVLGSAGAPPLAVSLGVAALGLITLVALIPAHRGSHAALRTIVGALRSRCRVRGETSGAAARRGRPKWTICARASR
jgi:hypothetical protein